MDELESAGGTDETVKLTADASGWNNALKEAESSARHFAAGAARHFAAAGKAVGGGLSAAGSALQSFGLKVKLTATAALTGLAAGTLDSLGEMSKVGAAGDAFGLSAEEATRLFGVMRSGGSDVRDATEGLVTLGQRVKDALSGSGEEAAAFFTALGVPAKAFADLNPAQQFDKLLDSLRAVENPALRVQLLLKAVGEDTGKNLIPLLGKSAAELAEMGRQFEVSAADMGVARDASAAYAQAVGSIGRVWDRTAVAVAPAVAQLAGGVADAASRAADWVKANQGLVVQAAAATAAVAAASAGVIGLGVSLSAAGTIVTTVAAGIGALATPLGLATTGLAVLGYGLVKHTEAGQRFVAGLIHDPVDAVHFVLGRLPTPPRTGL